MVENVISKDRGRLCALTAIHYIGWGGAPFPPARWKTARLTSWASASAFSCGNVGKVGYAAVSMRRIEQICDIKASIFLQMLCSLHCSISHCHHAGRQKWVGESGENKTIAFAVTFKFRCGLT